MCEMNDFGSEDMSVSGVTWKGILTVGAAMVYV